MKKFIYVLIFLLIISAFALDIHFSSSYEEYSMYNSNWNGTSFFIDDAVSDKAVLVEDYSVLKTAENSTLLIIEPDGDFSPDELRILRDYKNRDNTVFISDENGLSKDLLKVLGTNISVENVNLSSIDMEYDNPEFVISYPVKNVQENNLTEGIESIALNRPAVAGGGESIITTSILSWVDENGNERADSNEILGKQAVLVKYGNVYLLSDSGIFQNALYKDENLKDNRKFLSNMLTGTVYIESRHSKTASETGFLKYINIIHKNETVKALAIIIIILSLLFIYGGRHDK
ncbi:hypothetical protein J2128_001043 [Methanomicrobium sp. W14]|uniref:DUF4350 domain-containing protein n=1 Tax=Methanomicrobium sp. W14 TaxID=2817839 RepID=UPI001AEA094D|nr:DUF4350 domain-containing protein [Methanomicrobium sp. W14]MBP2133122.1 hypothetical protein [Methanomicrobium sp. W14]